VTLFDCQLWIDVRTGLLAAHSLHLPGTDSREVPRADRPGLGRYNEPYRVEALPGDRGADRPGTLVRGLPALTVVDPPGVASLLRHLTWDGVLDRSDAYWNRGDGRGTFRFPAGGAESQRMADYRELVLRLRRERGTYVVKVTSLTPGRPNGPVTQALFARRTPEELLDELRVAQVMEA